MRWNELPKMYPFLAVAAAKAAIVTVAARAAAKRKLVVIFQLLARIARQELVVLVHFKRVSLMKGSDIHMSDGGCKHCTPRHTARPSTFCACFSFGSRLHAEKSHSLCLASRKYTRNVIFLAREDLHTAARTSTSSTSTSTTSTDERDRHQPGYGAQGQSRAQSTLRNVGLSGRLAEQPPLTGYEPDMTFVPHTPKDIPTNLASRGQVFALQPHQQLT